MPTSPRAAGPAFHVGPGHAGGMLRSTPPFRADHVGSLLRPRLRAERARQRAAGEISDDDLRAVENAAITDVVRMQEDVGLRSATDGEFRRTSWHMDFIYQLGGVHQADEKLTVQFFNDAGTLDFASAALLVDEPITLPRTIFADAYEFLAESGPYGHAEDHHSVAEHGALPRWSGRDLDRRIPGVGRVLGRPVGRVRRRGARPGRPRLHIPATGRHQPRVPERSAAARDASRRTAATRCTSTSATSPRSTRRSPTGRPAWR